MSHRGNKKIFLLTSTLIIACLSLLAFSPACIEKVHPLTIENQTGQALQIFLGVEGMEDYTIEKYFHIGTIPAHKTVTIGDSGIVPKSGFDYHSLIEAKNDADTVLFSQWYTTDELEEIDWTIVIPPPSE
jgi:hypothetical protein